MYFEVNLIVCYQPFSDAKFVTTQSMSLWIEARLLSLQDALDKHASLKIQCRSSTIVVNLRTSR